MSLRYLAAAALLAAVPAIAAERRLPTGVRLDPVVAASKIGNTPFGLALAPDHRHAAVLLCGWRLQGVQIVDRSSGEVVQTLEQPAAFLGIVFAPDGKTFFASGGNDDVIYRYRFENGRAIADGSIVLAEKPDSKKSGVRYPAGLALSSDGSRLYVAENLGDSLAVIDTAQNKVVQRIDAGRYPYAVAVTPNGVFVSAWGEHVVDSFTVDASGALVHRARIAAGRHPSALVANANGSRLYVASASTDSIAIIDTKSEKVIATMTDAPPSGPHEGSTPNALTLSSDGRQLYVAEGDNNAVAVFSTTTRKLLGRIPVEWYPAALASDGEQLVVANAKGSGSGPNPDMYQPGQKSKNTATAFTLGQLDGSLMTLRPSSIDLAATSKRVALANGWNAKRATRPYPPFRHVIYIIKENRTYDQILGDMKEGDGDPSLVFFGREISPNHHALADRFGLFDRFFVNAEVSAHGHNWSTAAYVTDYVTKSVPQQYGGKGRTYDYEGTNRGKLVDDDDDDVASPSTGYLWDLAIRKGITFRNYGEFVVDPADFGGDEKKDKRQATKKSLAPHTNFNFAPYDMLVPDQQRVDAWMADFEQFLLHGMPALQILRLPNDHTMGATAKQRTPRAYMADNDLAIGRVVSAVSHSRFWRDTAILILEDDAQNGPDHVDSHRSVLLAVSAYNRPGAIHRFVNTTDVLATIEELLGLEPMSQFDHYGRPLRDIFATTPDLRPYDVIVPDVNLNERNPANTPAAKASAQLDLDEADEADDDLLNRVLWMAIKGDDVPYPGPSRAPVAVLDR